MFTNTSGLSIELEYNIILYYIEKITSGNYLDSNSKQNKLNGGQTPPPALNEDSCSKGTKDQILSLTKMPKFHPGFQLFSISQQRSKVMNIYSELAS